MYTIAASAHGAESFLEVETLVADTTEISVGLDAVQAVLDALGVREDQLTTESYTDAVAAIRRA